MLDHLERELARAQRGALPLTVALADVDHFKSINDAYGHDAGDRVLREVAARMQRSLRKSDAIGRYGGEEFLLVLSSAGSAREASVGTALERIRAAVCSSPISLPSGALTVSVSIGTTTVAPGGEDAATIIANADAGLYQAKAEGRNCVRVACAEARPDQDPSVMTPRRMAYSTMSV